MTTREKILATATELFIERGFDKTTIRDICAAAGVNVAAVNYHFRGKQQLIEAIIDSIVERRSEQRLKILSNRTISNETEWRQVIINFINSMVLDNDSGSKNEFILVRLFMSGLKNPPEFFAKIHHKYFEPLDRELIRYIEMGLSDDAPQGSAALWVMTIISQCLLFRQHHNILNNLSNIDFTQPENSEILAKHIANTVFAGLKYRKC
jgi:TetR/AcrR family transcriptional regulator, regulator of cefoperazone and chloramphenicol sensitivity